MGEALQAAGTRSNGCVVQPCKFGTIVRALWPVKPALNLAQRIGCTERAAQFYIDGERKPSARALFAVMNDLIS
jgi:hypothetical protein